MTAPLPVATDLAEAGLYTAVHVEPLGGDRYCVTGSGPDGHRSVVVTGADTAGLAAIISLGVTR
jgi:hypothetical protein